MAKTKLSKLIINRVQHWDDERNSGNGIIVTLKRGWCFDPLTHVKGFDTIKEAKEAISFVQKCRCDYCLWLED